MSDLQSAKDEPDHSPSENIKITDDDKTITPTAPLCLECKTVPSEAICNGCYHTFCRTCIDDIFWMVFLDHQTPKAFECSICDGEVTQISDISDGEVAELSGLMGDLATSTSENDPGTKNDHHEWLPAALWVAKYHPELRIALRVRMLTTDTDVKLIKRGEGWGIVGTEQMKIPITDEECTALFENYEDDISGFARFL